MQRLALPWTCILRWPCTTLTQTCHQRLTGRSQCRLVLMRRRPHHMRPRTQILLCAPRALTRLRPPLTRQRLSERHKMNKSIRSLRQTSLLLQSKHQCHLGRSPWLRIIVGRILKTTMIPERRRHMPSLSQVLPSILQQPKILTLRRQTPSLPPLHRLLLSWEV